MVKQKKSNMALGILTSLENSNNEETVKEKFEEATKKQVTQKSKRSFMLSQEAINKLEDIKYNKRKQGNTTTLSEIIDELIIKHFEEI